MRTSEAVTPVKKAIVTGQQLCACQARLLWEDNLFAELAMYRFPCVRHRATLEWALIATRSLPGRLILLAWHELRFLSPFAHCLSFSMNLMDPQYGQESKPWSKTRCCLCKLTSSHTFSNVHFFSCADPSCSLNTCVIQYLTHANGMATACDCAGCISFNE